MLSIKSIRKNKEIRRLNSYPGVLKANYNEMVKELIKISYTFPDSII